MIHYGFVGYLEIPESDTPCFTADTSQGVAIGYISKPQKSQHNQKSHSVRNSTIHKTISNYIQNSILSKKIEYSQVKSLMNTQYGADVHNTSSSPAIHILYFVL